MAVRNLGTLQANITADTKSLKKNLADGEKQFKGFSDKTTKTLKAVGVGLIAVGAAATAMTITVAKSAIRFEQLMKGLNSVAGSADEAAKQLKILREVAKLPGLGLSEVVKASINLQAVRIDAEKAAFYIAEMGNALATVGAGRAELEGVVRGMSQMTSRGKVLAEEINQISERVPQFRSAMIDAFGTAVSEDIQKMGITVDEFLTKTVEQLAKLPRVAGGAANSIENLGDAATELSVALGTVFLPTITKGADELAKIVDRLNNLTNTQKAIVSWGTAVGGALALVSGAALLVLPKIPLMITGLTTLFAFPAAIPVTLGIVALGAAAIVAVKAFRDFNNELDVMTARKIHKESIDAQAEAMGELQRSIQGADFALKTITVSFDGASTGLTRLDAISAALGDDIVVLDSRFESINRLLGDTDGYISVTDAAAKVTSALAGVTATTTENTSALKSVLDVIFNPFKAFSTALKNTHFEMSKVNAEVVSFLDAAPEVKQTTKERLDALTAENKGLREQASGMRDGSELLVLSAAAKKMMAGVEADLAFQRDRETEAFLAQSKSEVSALHIEQRSIEMGIEAEERGRQAKEKTAKIEQKVVEDYVNLLAKRVKVEETTWLDIANITNKGASAVGNAYLGIVDIWRTVLGDQRAFHDTWLSGMVNWVNRISGLLNDLTTVWRSAMKIINAFSGGDGVGSAIGAAAGGGSALGTAASGAGLLAKIGGGIKAGAVAAGSGIATGAAAVAPFALAALPFLGFGAAAFGLSKLNDIPDLGHVFKTNTGEAAPKTAISVGLAREREETRKLIMSLITTPTSFVSGSPTTIGRNLPAFAQGGGSIGLSGGAGVDRIVGKLDQILRAMTSGASGGSSGFGLLGKDAKEFWTELGGIGRSFREVGVESARLEDELAGHSLTTALDDTRMAVKMTIAEINEYEKILNQYGGQIPWGVPTPKAIDDFWLRVAGGVGRLKTLEALKDEGFVGTVSSDMVARITAKTAQNDIAGISSAPSAQEKERLKKEATAASVLAAKDIFRRDIDIASAAAVEARAARKARDVLLVRATEDSRLQELKTRAQIASMAAEQRIAQSKLLLAAEKQRITLELNADKQRAIARINTEKLQLTSAKTAAQTASTLALARQRDANTRLIFEKTQGQAEENARLQTQGIDQNNTSINLLRAILGVLESRQAATPSISQRELSSALWEIIAPSARQGGFV